MKLEYNEIFKSEDFKDIKFNESLSLHTSFKIGGKADVFLNASSKDEIIKAISLAKAHKIKYFIMGNGSNLLVKDGGYRGLIIKIRTNYSDYKIESNKIICEAGMLMSTLSKIALKNSLKGFEFASGIPGSLGGGVTMNAGAYGGEMKDVVTRVWALDEDLNEVSYSRDEMNFSYRTSRIKDDNLIVLGVEVSLEDGNKDEIEEKINDYTFRRTSKQPLEFPSGGSTFKRPEGYFAGQLIETTGLRGLEHGGAQVSNKHCGFIINKDNASCKDVLDLIETIQKLVEDKHGVKLEREIKLVGDD